MNDSHTMAGLTDLRLMAPVMEQDWETEMWSSSGNFSASTGTNCLDFDEQHLLVLSPFIWHHTDISVTFTDVTSIKEKVQFKK